MEIFTEKFMEKMREELRQIAIDRKLEKHTDQKHTDRQIYDECIYLMKQMVDCFREYFEYLGVDIDE